MSLAIAGLRPVYESVTLPALMESLRHVFRTADHAIVMLATAATDNYEQNRYFESAQQLRIIHRNLMQRFVEHWFSPLSETPITIDADAEHIASLRKLMNQSANIGGDNSAQDLLNPSHIYQSFLYCLAEAELDVHSKMLVLRAFEARLNDDLPALSEQAKPELAKVGVAAQVVALKPVATPAMAGEGKNLLGLALADLQASDYEVLETRLSPSVLQTFSPPPEARDLLTEVRIAQLLSSAPSADELQCVQNIRKLFSIIQADQRLSAPARALLSYLQLPYTRIALHDDTFFTDDENLAKALLNEVVRLAANWQPNNEELSRDPFCQKLSDMVTTFWEAERVGQIPYQQMLFDLLLYGEDERQQQQVTSQRFLESQQGAMQATLIREQVDALVAQKFQSTVMPVAVEQLLEEGWKHVMYLAGLRYGVESDDWQSAVQVLDQLIETLQPAETYTSRTQFLILLPSLLRKLREGLLFIQLSPSVINHLFAELEAEHKKIAASIKDSELDDEALASARAKAANVHLPLGQQAAASVSLTKDQAPLETIELQDNQLALQAETANARNEKMVALAVIESPAVALTDEELAQKIAIEKLESLGQGALIMWNRDTGQERCRIAAYIKHTRKYILTGRGGVKVAEWLYDEMLEKLISGELETLESGQIFERALESVIGRMRDQR